MAKKTTSSTVVQSNPWRALRRFTDARIALGRVGDSLPTDMHLEFQLAHAKARDAVHLPLDFELLQRRLASNGLPVLQLSSQATDRACYLRRPDLGRRLDEASLNRVANYLEGERRGYDVAIVITDGLSSLGVERNAVPLLDTLLPALASRELRMAPLCLVRQGRVAVGDEIATALQASLVLILVGERPGLSSPDSLGAYLTYKPEIGTPDSKRNCLSNIRSGGMTAEDATSRLCFLIDEALKRRYTGVELKDETEIEEGSIGQNFLLPNAR